MAILLGTTMHFMFFPTKVFHCFFHEQHGCCQTPLLGEEENDFVGMQLP